MPALKTIPTPVPQFPLVVLGHDTETELELAPSAAVEVYGEAHITPIVYQAELLASMGYIVLVPDYPGLSGDLGQRRDIEPHLVPQSTEAILGMIDHVLDSNSPDTVHSQWNGKIAFMGYGYGAYALMRTASVIDTQVQHPLKGALKAMVGLNGIYSMDKFYSGFVKPQSACVEGEEDCISASRWRSLPGYLFALSVDAYHRYQAEWERQGLEAAIIPNPNWSAQHLLKLLHSGTASLSHIEGYIKSHPKYQAGQGPLSITTPEFQAFLKQIRPSLNIHDAYHLWSTHKPTSIALHLIYHPFDKIGGKQHINAVLAAKINAKTQAMSSKTCPQPGWGTHRCPTIINQAFKEGIHVLEKILK